MHRNRGSNQRYVENYLGTLPLHHSVGGWTLVILQVKLENHLNYLVLDIERHDNVRKAILFIFLSSNFN